VPAGLAVPVGAADDPGVAIPAPSRFGIPLSTTHTIGTAIMGVGATRRLSAVNWNVGRQIVATWVVTFPARSLLR
jgi:inorganic phosphate transporter, PiT family